MTSRSCESYATFLLSYGRRTDELREQSEDLAKIAAPVQGAPEMLHHAALSSLAKIIIRQAEAEVTAHKEQAVPLAKLAVSLIARDSLFADIFWAKLCDLVGCWIAPAAASSHDAPDGEKQYLKLWSRRPDELQDAQTMRITGVLRLYFHMLLVPVQSQLPPPYRPARLWAYLATLLANPALLERAVAPEAIYGT